MPRWAWIAVSVITALAFWTAIRSVLSDSVFLSFRGRVSLSDASGRPIPVPPWILPLVLLLGAGVLMAVLLRRSR